MGTINVTLPADGTGADAADYNGPINDIVSELNGNLDGNNIADAALSNSKLVNRTRVLPIQMGVPYNQTTTRLGVSYGSAVQFAIGTTHFAHGTARVPTDYAGGNIIIKYYLTSQDNLVDLSLTHYLAVQQTDESAVSWNLEDNLTIPGAVTIPGDLKITPFIRLVADGEAEAGDLIVCALRPNGHTAGVNIVHAEIEYTADM